jgi:diguanylate cyclase (GGDEF)-like protein/PAS domain S-box-containing protein
MAHTPQPTVPIPKRGKQNFFAVAFYWLTKPPAYLPEIQRLTARWLSALLLFSLPVLLILLPLLLSLPSFRNSAQLWVYLALLVLLSACYLISRLQGYDLAALLTACIVAAAVWAFAITDPRPAALASDLVFVIVSVLLGSLLLSFTRSLWLIGLHLAALTLTALLFPARISFAQAVALMAVTISGSVLTVLISLLRERDRDEIKRQGQALREAEERFHLISFATSDVVWEWDLSTGQVWRNQGIQRLFGYRDSQVEANMDWWRERIHPEDRVKANTSMDTAIQRGDQFWSKEYRLRRADGTYAHVFDRSYILRNERGQAVRLVGAVMDISSRVQSEEVLLQEAVHDPLTGLYNRRYMENVLDQEIRRAKWNHQPVSIILLDIDHFKQVNDTLGHSAGDELLRDLAAFLLKHVRDTDTVCRYGGDEFILILPTASLEIAQLRGDEICRGVPTLDTRPYGSLPFSLSVSVGVAVFPEHGDTSQSLFDAADEALYVSKKAGRNRVSVARMR